ncbi:MAG: hypothetical protein Q9163_005940 [Psora crenata]
MFNDNDSNTRVSGRYGNDDSESYGAGSSRGGMGGVSDNDSYRPTSPPVSPPVSEPISHPVSRPPLPELTATSIDVHNFIVQFLLSQDWELTGHEARQRAKRIKGDGITLYRVSRKRWTDELGMDGQMIYQALQTSKCGNYWMRIGHWLEGWLLALVDGNSRPEKASRTTLSPSHPPSSAESSSYTTRYVGPHASTAAHGSPNESKSDKGWEHVTYGPQRRSVEDSVDNTKCRRLFRNDID